MSTVTGQVHAVVQMMVWVTVSLSLWLAGPGPQPHRADASVAVGQPGADFRRQWHAWPACEDDVFAAPLPPAPPVFVLQAGTDAQVARSFMLFLQHNGFEAHIYETLFVMVRHNNVDFLMELKTDRGVLSRVLVARVFDLMREHHNSLAIAAYIMRLNKTFDFANFALSEKADRLIVQGSITFVDQLEAQEVRTFLDFFHHGTVQMFDLLPESADYLR